MGNVLSIVNNKTFVGWTVIAVACVGYYVVKYHNNELKLTAQKQRVLERQGSQAKKENKAKRQRMESFANESKQSQPKPQPSITQPQANKYSSDEGADNRAFAQQMAQNKKSKFAAQITNEQKQKSVKQSKAKAISEEADTGKVSAPSSTAGIDADDDQSPVPSPEISTADPTGVSDMLEQPAPAALTLRLTDTAEKQKKSKPAKAPQPVETKKQRQNRKKAEQAKAIREEEEAARKVIMEAQRRTARLAEGRAAKDGSAFVAAQQKSSPWTGNGTNGSSKQNAAPVLLQPLDTFESTPKADAAASSAPNGKENRKQNGNPASWTDVPYSEEEQMAMLQQQAEEDEWVPVKSRKNKKTTGVPSETDESAAEMPPPTTDKPAPKTKLVATNGRPTLKASMGGSFAALPDDGAALSDEQHEQEWDV